MTVINSDVPKAAAKLKLMFNKHTSVFSGCSNH